MKADSWPHVGQISCIVKSAEETFLGKEGGGSLE